MGSCKIIRPGICGKGSGSATFGRKIAYWQADNVNSRKCGKVYPGAIQSAGFTHLNYAFASIDPVSFAIKREDQEAHDDPKNPGPSLYRAFTALKTSELQTWIAVGGFDFSDENKPTHSTTWSDLTSTQDNRAKFISSLKTFMSDYDFQGKL